MRVPGGLFASLVRDGWVGALRGSRNGPTATSGISDVTCLTSSEANVVGWCASRLFRGREGQEDKKQRIGSTTPLPQIMIRRFVTNCANGARMTMHEGTPDCCSTSPGQGPRFLWRRTTLRMLVLSHQCTIHGSCRDIHPCMLRRLYITGRILSSSTTNDVQLQSQKSYRSRFILLSLVTYIYWESPSKVGGFKLTGRIEI